MNQKDVISYGLLIYFIFASLLTLVFDNVCPVLIVLAVMVGFVFASLNPLPKGVQTEGASTPFVKGGM